MLEVFLGVLVELFLATGRAEVVGFSLMGALEFRSLLFHFHLTHWINRHCDHRLSIVVVKI